MPVKLKLLRNPQNNRIELIEEDDDGFIIHSEDITEQAIKEVLDHLFEAQGVKCGSLTFERTIEPESQN